MMNDPLEDDASAFMLSTIYVKLSSKETYSYSFLPSPFLPSLTQY